MSALADSALDQLFHSARSFNGFTDEPVSDATLHALYDLLKWGSTSANSKPARFVFLKSQAARERLRPTLSPGNLDKTMAAPMTVIVAYDTRFYEYLPTQYPASNFKPIFENNPPLAAATAFRNGTLQGAYLIVAARALGLACGPMSGFDTDKVNREFFPDGRLQANFLCNLGRGDPAKVYPRGPRLSFDEVCSIL